MGILFVLIIFVLVMSESVVCQSTTCNTNADNSACGYDQQQQFMLLQQFQQFQQNVKNQLQSIQQQVRDQSELIEQLQQNANNHNCCSESVVRYYDLQFQVLPLVYRRSRDQLVRELQTICNPLLVQQNVAINGSNFFNRTWEEYKVGFNDSNGNYWLGNELLHQLTMNNKYKLRFDLQSRDNNSLWFWAEYSTFIVDNESLNYTLHCGGFSGNVSFDAFIYVNGRQFSTKDRNNDVGSNGYSCAMSYGGGFWYNHCAWGTVNSVLAGYAHSWQWLSTNYMLLLTTRMWLICL